MLKTLGILISNLWETFNKLYFSKKKSTFLAFYTVDATHRKNIIDAMKSRIYMQVDSNHLYKIYKYLSKISKNRFKKQDFPLRTYYHNGEIMFPKFTTLCKML